MQSVAEVRRPREHPRPRPKIWGHEKNLHDALIWLCREIVVTKDRVESIARDSKITLSLQQRRRDEESICLITISYPGLRIDQLKVGEPTTTEEYPTVPVYLAREVIRFHFGTVHIFPGPPVEGELMIAGSRSRRVNSDRRGRSPGPQAGGAVGRAPAVSR